MFILIFGFIITVIGLSIAWRRHVLDTKKRNSEVLKAARRQALEDLMSKPAEEVHTILKGSPDP